MMNLASWSKWIFGFVGAVAAYLKPTAPFVLVCTLAVLYDCYTAFRLSKRVSKKYPGANDGKFKTDYAKRIFSTILKIYALIILAYLIEKEVITFLDLHLHNIVAGVFCLTQILSILENESSENGSRWAKILQKVLVNKAERHFDVDLSEFKKQENENTD
ncbi:MAG: phage holin family protein [Prevotellaceae bacterium]|jgi:hypothetical protein|nr:phage holin family protein [Prevotellaceae bacterium]